MTFLTGNPSDRFMLWTRRVLLLVWAVLLVTQLPSFFEQAQQIVSSAVSGPDRNAALRRLAGEAFAILVIAPLFLLVVIGYGISVNPAAWLTGRPWFGAWWRPRHRQKPPPRDGRV